MFLQDSAAARTGGDRDLPRGGMAALATVGSEGHSELGELTRSTRTGGFELLKIRIDRARDEGDLEAAATRPNCEVRADRTKRYGDPRPRRGGARRT